MMTPISVSAASVRAAGITPARFAIWAVEKAHEGKTDQALRLLDAAKALIADDGERERRWLRDFPLRRRGEA